MAEFIVQRNKKSQSALEANGRIDESNNLVEDIGL